MEPLPAEPWVFVVEPYEGESISHFLGRFRRENYSTCHELGQKSGLGAVLARWEKFRFVPPPSEKELAVLSSVVQVDVARLRLMLPPEGESMKLEPIRLCAACYGEQPYHRIEWQLQSVWKCDRHQLRLLAKCPKCEARFKIPALWDDGCCKRCRTPLFKLRGLQRSV